MQSGGLFSLSASVLNVADSNLRALLVAFVALSISIYCAFQIASVLLLRLLALQLCLGQFQIFEFKSIAATDSIL